jgi:hypothetical protein
MPQITVIYGANTWPVNIEDCDTVNDVHNQVEDLFNIPAGTSATVNGSSVDDGHILNEGDRLQFNKETGTKG